MPTLSIIIVNWNAGRQLYACLSSVVEAAAAPDVMLKDVIVVDNGSTDGSENSIEGLPNVTLIRAGANLGFGKACNLGAIHAASEFLLFLNPDARLFPGSLPKVIEFMTSPESATIGICGIKLTDESGNFTTSAARFPTLKIMTGKILGLARLFPGFFPSHLMTATELMHSAVVDQVIGAFFLVRREVYEVCGGFDERFFVYFEEVDFSLRAKKLGYASYYLADAMAYHKGGGCSDKVKAARLFYSLRSRIYYANKHYSYSERVMLVLLTIAEFFARLLRAFVTLSPADFYNTTAAYINLVKYFLGGRK
jgi:GT2 family glycosyltransferase